MSDEMYMLGYASESLKTILTATSLIEAQARSAFALEEILDAGLDISAKDVRDLRKAITEFDASLAIDESLDELADATRQLGDAAATTTQAIHDREEKR